MNTAMSDYNIITFTETWLCGSFFDAELFSNEFYVVRRDRHQGQLLSRVGGGILIALDKNLYVETVNAPGSDSLEFLCVRVKSA